LVTVPVAKILQKNNLRKHQSPIAGIRFLVTKFEFHHLVQLHMVSLLEIRISNPMAGHTLIFYSSPTPIINPYTHSQEQPTGKPSPFVWASPIVCNFLTSLR
jgi:hypothetical protein